MLNFTAENVSFDLRFPCAVCIALGLVRYILLAPTSQSWIDLKLSDWASISFCHVDECIFIELSTFLPPGMWSEPFLRTSMRSAPFCPPLVRQFASIS